MLECGYLPAGGIGKNMYALRHTANNTTTALHGCSKRSLCIAVVVHVF